MHTLKSSILTIALCSLSYSSMDAYIPTYQEAASFTKHQYQYIKRLWGDKRYPVLLVPSPWIGNHICRYINNHAILSILINNEGFGSITDQIIGATQSKSVIDIFEQHSLLRQELQERIAHFAPRTVYLHANTLEASTLQGKKDHYDMVITRLSINQLTFESLEHLLTRIAKLTKAGGMVVYFDFYGRVSFNLVVKIVMQFVLESVNTYVKKVSDTRLVCASQEIKTLMTKRRLLRNWQEEHFNVIDTKVAWLNALPIAIVCLQKQ